MGYTSSLFTGQSEITGVKVPASTLPLSSDSTASNSSVYRHLKIAREKNVQQKNQNR